MTGQFPHPLEGAKTVRPGRPSHWTPERVAELVRLWAAGDSAAAIAKQIGGISRCSVIGKAHRLKLASRVSGFVSSGIRSTKPRVAGPKPPKPPKPKRSAQPTTAPVRVNVEVLSPNPLTILDLPLTGACRWIVDVDQALSCGNPCGKATYCPGHHRIAHDRVPKLSASQVEWVIRGLERKKLNTDDKALAKPWHYQAGMRRA